MMPIIDPHRPGVDLRQSSSSLAHCRSFSQKSSMIRCLLGILKHARPAFNWVQILVRLVSAAENPTRLICAEPAQRLAFASCPRYISRRQLWLQR